MSDTKAAAWSMSPDVVAEAKAWLVQPVQTEPQAIAHRGMMTAWIIARVSEATALPPAVLPPEVAAELAAYRALRAEASDYLIWREGEDDLDALTEKMDAMLIRLAAVPQGQPQGMGPLADVEAWLDALLIAEDRPVFTVGNPDESEYWNDALRARFGEGGVA